MKILFSALVALTSLASLADTPRDILKKPCTFQDFQKISYALKNYEIVHGKGIKAAVEDMMRQEMAPMCIRVTSMSMVSMIPGRRSFHYQLTSGTTFVIRITEDMESHRNSLELYRSSAAQ